MDRDQRVRDASADPLLEMPSAVDATPEIVTLLALRRMGTVTGDLRLRRRIYRRRKRIRLRTVRGPNAAKLKAPNQNVGWGSQIPLRRFHGQALRGQQ